MEALREKKTELMRAALLGAIGAAAALLLILAFAFACSAWLAEEAAAPVFTRAVLFAAAGVSAFLSARGGTGGKLLPAAVSGGILLLLPAALVPFVPEGEFAGMPFLASLLAVILGTALGFKLSLGGRKRRRRRRR